ncbi:protein-L-isoaspartate(D-aspartate) O-methyltransferase [Streptomyces sp. NPDC059786]|uniref:protein-L-isoaspartate(D-aspartate) O-methyltransferase n=1 Tax=Streptomyces sp. NPDC059786 TaxID=3346946 RepID=UPI003662FB80
MAGHVVRPESRWHGPLASTPRHLFVPRWWVRTDAGRQVRDGQDDPAAWMQAAYADQTVVTRVGPLHADHADLDTVLTTGRSTSSSTHPSLVVTMYRHASLGQNSQTLVTTGSGYGTALLCQRLGDHLVTSVDIDPYLVDAATERLASLGLFPRTAVADLTEPLPWTYDRIVSTVSVRRIPATWLHALRPGGRMVTTLSGTGLILVADKTADGGAQGHIAYEGASFMSVRHGVDYEDDTAVSAVWEKAQGDGEEVSTSRYPLLYPPNAWDVWSMMELKVPGIEYRKIQDGNTLTVWLLHPDGSWARATARGHLDSPVVHESGPRYLWDSLDRVRNRLNREGSLPVYGARVTITPDGTTTLTRGAWEYTL